MIYANITFCCYFLLLDYDFKDFFAAAKTNKKWISKFTALTRRKDDIQKEKLKRKVKNVVRICDSFEKLDGERNSLYCVTSSYLQQFFIPESPLHHMNAAFIETKIEKFYTNDLVPLSTVRCGSMLKNWADIPGRDISPQRDSQRNILTSRILSDIENSIENQAEKSASQPLQTNQEAATSAYGKSGQCHIVDVTDGCIDQAISGKEDRTVRQNSPDMFADYESSANNSFDGNLKCFFVNFILFYNVCSLSVLEHFAKRVFF